jgi:hypothetical protein
MSAPFSGHRKQARLDVQRQLLKKGTAGEGMMPDWTRTTVGSPEFGLLGLNPSVPATVLPIGFRVLGFQGFRVLGFQGLRV